mgnify:CR=1 FL=1
MRTKEELLELISDVVNGKIHDVELDYPLPIDKIGKYLKETHNLEDTDEFDHNSWSYDYWCYYEGVQGRFCLGGSGYYSTQSFSKED